MPHASSPAGLPTGDTAEVARILQDPLIDVSDLGSSLKHAHWGGVVGPDLMPTHELFESHADAVRPLAYTATADCLS
jgi:DNA-binding ferritin-like protein